MPVPDWLSPIADVLSIVSFGLTIWVLFETHSLRRSFALRGRVPELKRSLTSSAKKLPTLLSRWPQSRNETLAIIASARAVLENLLIKLPRRERTAVQRLVREMRGRRISLINYVPISSYTEDDMWNIFAGLQEVIASLEQRERDATWE